ncbi:hypothetical protein [Janibacter sp. LM]|uniref:hypothetical protein n=1 Tax=Janibacter sp. LM TaxID=3144845 RepID=UPI0031F684A0
MLTTGFAAGPLASGLIAQFTPGRIGLVVAFAVPALLTGLSALLCLLPDHASVVAPATKPHPARDGSSAPFVEDRRIGPDLAASLPMGLWVFSCVVIAMIVLTERIGGQYGGPMRRRWRPSWPWAPGSSSSSARARSPAGDRSGSSERRWRPPPSSSPVWPVAG